VEVPRGCIAPAGIAVALLLPILLLLLVGPPGNGMCPEGAVRLRRTLLRLQRLQGGGVICEASLVGVGG